MKSSRLYQCFLAFIVLALFGCQVFKVQVSVTPEKAGAGQCITLTIQTETTGQITSIKVALDNPKTSANPDYFFDVPPGNNQTYEYCLPKDAPTGIYNVAATVKGENNSRGFGTASFEMVENNPPVVAFGSPADGTIFIVNPPDNYVVKCIAGATDQEDGDLPCDRIIFTVDTTDQIGKGCFFYAENLPLGESFITATATDSLGATASTRIKVILKQAEHGAPEIVIDHISDYGDSGGIVTGHITNTQNLNYQDCVVAGQISVENNIWPKPTYAQPYVFLNPDWTFVFDYTTGGSDACAEEIRLCLVQKSATIANCDPCFEFTDPSEVITCKTKNQLAEPRKITFSDLDWYVKSSLCPIGPGPNYFSDKPEDIWVDDQGLHLTIRNKDGKWICTEVISLDSFGYGTYRIVTKGRLDLLDPMAVLGIFTWDTSAHDISFRELDIEFARWGRINDQTNSQYVIQPCSACPGCIGHCTRYRVELSEEQPYLTLFMVWQAGKVEFRTYYGEYAEGVPPDSALVYKWTYAGLDVPEPGKENFRFNYWLFNGTAPLDSQDAEVVIKRFNWEVGSPNWNTPITTTTSRPTTTSIVPITTTSSVKTTTSTSSTIIVVTTTSSRPTTTTTSVVVTTSTTSSSTTSIIVGSPKVFIDGASPLGDIYGHTWGHVSGVNPSEYVVVVYIQVDGYFWIKPFVEASGYSSLTEILTDMTWDCDTTTGGIDQTATIIRAYLWKLSDGLPPQTTHSLDTGMPPGVPYAEIDRTTM